MKKYFVKHDGNAISVYLFNVDSEPCSASMISLRVEQGVVRQIETSKSLSSDDAQALIQQGLEHGLQEVDQRSYDETLATAKATLEERFVERGGEEYRILAWRDLKPILKSPFKQEPAELLAPHLQNFQVYQNALASKRDITIQFDSLAPEVQTGSRNLAFRSGLTIDGNLDAGSNCTTLPQFVYVEGDLVLKNLILSGWVELIVTGNLIASDVVIGYDGESGGRLSVGGHLTAQDVLGGSMFGMEVKQKVNARVHWLSDDEPSLSNARIIPTSLSQKDWPHRARLTSLTDVNYAKEDDWTSEGKVTVHSFNFDLCLAAIREKMPIFRDK